MYSNLLVHSSLDLAASKAYLAAYSCGTYGSGSYDTNCQTTTNGTPAGQLSYTGVDAYLPLIIGVVLIAVGVVAIILRRRKR